MSQGYTPVTWQDETTSQQGTLINAARLDQMQTAHHYADGWREVDAVPTADPGVDYHMVVYCTADSTFYRWNGSAWTKDIDDVTKAELDAEIERATLAEGALDSAKADKATTLAGYGITDAYTKAQTDTLLAGKMDDGDAYTKAEADTLLAGKADVSALTDGSVTMLGTADVGGDLYPIKLVAGVPTAVANALVDTANAQTIDGIKSFNYTPRGATFTSTTSGYKELLRIAPNSNFTSVTTYLVGRFIDKSSNRTVTFNLAFRTSSYQPVLKTSAPINGLFCTQAADGTVSVWSGSQRVIAYADTLSRGNYNGEYSISSYVQAGTINAGATKPTVGDDYLYVEDSIITDDLVDTATLDGYASMVRTTGNQTIGGIKTFSSGIARSGGDVHNLIEDTTSKDITSGTVWYGGSIRYYDTNGVEIGRIFIRANANATSTLGIEVRNSDGTFKFISLGTGDVIS